MRYYQLFADMVFLLHASFVFFAVFGGLAVSRWQRLAWFYLPAARAIGGNYERGDVLRTGRK